MLKRLNFTNRKRILKSNISISLIGEKDESKSFRAIIDTSNLELPGESVVAVEAWHRMMLSQRYNFGTVDEITPPRDTSLGLLGFTEAIKFRVYVVDGNGKILASSSRISITKEEKKDSLLPVVVTDLDDLVWKISMDGDEGSPILEINKRIHAIKTVAAFDPRFILSVYPAVLRQILMQIAVIDNVDLQDPDFDWQANWVLFFKGFFSPPPEGRHSDLGEDIREWIEGAVQAFARYRKSDWNNKVVEWEP